MRLLLPILCMALTTALAAELPVHEVILYKSGVGYFERQGKLDAGDAARLDFKAEEMNDVLKSLSVRDLSGGKINGLRYDSSGALDQKLARFPFKLGDNQSLSGFLDQVKGSAIELKSGVETIFGTIVGARSIGASEREPSREQAVLLLGTGDLRTFDLSQVTSLRFADSRLQAQLKDYLAALDQARSRDKRSVYIDSPDGNSRDIIASYMVPTPVWKSSYRLIFGEKPEPLLEGWAIVDNTTGDDWNNVRLAVVSGRPVSFISRLYEPRFLQRPTVELPEDRPVAPSVYEGGVAGGVIGGMVSGSGGGVGPAPLASPRAVNGRIGKRLELSGQPGFAADVNAMQSTVMVNTEGRDLGELFEYSFSMPVTVKKNESAMLPFLQQGVLARKLLIYREGSGINPMSAAEITNSTGKTLDGGPITVFEGNGYSGEALVETVKSGDKRLISYAIDLGTRVTTGLDSSDEIVREVHLNRGILTTKLAAEETKTYTIRNVDAKPKTLIIEHPLRQGYQVLNQKPVETTSSAYRFELKLAPGSTEKFSVKEERVYSTEMGASNMTPDVMLQYIRNRSISEAARKALQQIRDQKEKIGGKDNDVRQTESALNDVISDEQRIRQNIDSLRMVQSQMEQVNKYAAQLASQETQIATLRGRLSQLKKDRDAQQAELDGMIAKLEF